MKQRIAVVLLALCVALVAGCGAINEAAQNVANRIDESLEADDATLPVESAPPEEAEMSDVEKFNAYIDVSNLLHGRMDLCLTGYESRISTLDNEYSVKKKNFDGWINSIDEYEKGILQKAFDYASQRPAMEPVDSAYIAFEPIAMQMADALCQAYEYYEAKGYVDDQFEKGEVIHQQLMDNYEQYIEKATEFLQVLTELEHERTLKNLEHFQENGAMLLYWSNVFLLNAQELCNYLVDIEFKKDAAQIDAEVYRALYDELANSQAEFAKVATDEQAEAEGIRILFSSFKSAVTDVKAAAAGITQKLDEGEKIKQNDINEVLDEYSDIIDDYNRMIR